ncbi:MAG: ABC transporter ATP-binding protein [Anaerolineae bacterium]
MATKTKLHLRGMSRVFGATKALSDFNLEISDGMFVSLLGPSGCGKSTALNCIAGLLDLSAGEILLDGKPIQHIPAEKRGFGMVFQNYALFPHLNVIKNVSYGLENRRMPKSEMERRIRWALDLVHLDYAEFGHRFPAQLSGGQQQRLAIARTIALEPHLLLLDEPLSNLDAKLRNEMRIEIKRMHHQLGLTTIYVTHDQSEAMSLSDLIVVMQKGRIEQVGTPQEIYNCPNSLYVADFMGYSNRLPVRIVSREGAEWIVQTMTGVTLRASSTYGGNTDWKEGDQVLAVSRADELLADPLPETNQLSGIVHLVEYVGKAFEVLVRLDGDEDTQLLVSSQSASELERPIRFGIRPSRLLLFPLDDNVPISRPKVKYPGTTGTLTGGFDA